MLPRQMSNLLSGMGWVDDGMRRNPILRDSTLIKIAARHQATPAEVVLNWAVSKNIAVLPSTANTTRLIMNINR